MLSLKVLIVVLVVCLINTTFIICAVPFDPNSIPDDNTGDTTQVTKSSWLRRQVSRLGGVAGEVGNAVGRATVSVSTTADKICDLVKKIIPIVAAICHVGQFKFCAATGMTPSESFDSDSAGIDTTKLETLD